MPREQGPATVPGVTWRRGQSTFHILPETLIEAAVNGSRLRLQLTRLMAIGILAAFCLGTSYWTNSHPVVEKSLFIVGIAMASFGAAGRAWATAYISGQKSKQLVTTGPYSLSRNPLYFFSMVLAVGFGFCTKTFSAPLVIMTILVVLTYFQIWREEQRLRSKFGDLFDSYLAK